MNADFRAVEWVGGTDGWLRILDQTRLPAESVHRECRTPDDVWHAIQQLAVRGAPAIGIAAAYGMILGTHGHISHLTKRLRDVGAFLKSSRPTAVNLAWAVDQMQVVAEALPDSLPIIEFVGQLLQAAHKIRDDDAAMCRAMGAHGAKLISESTGILTHCNTGGLATAEYGTALGVIRTAWELGARFRVYVDETRPLWQGSRLTCWELGQLGIDHMLVCDSAAGLLMKQGKIGAVIVGADRIAANGDTANKIGTYGLAVLAKHHRIPFYVAAPSSTIDHSLAHGAAIPIEERDPKEVCGLAPAGTPAYNPAFDVTPAALITAIVTEKGVIPADRIHEQAVSQL